MALTSTKKISIPKDLHRGLKSAAAQADLTLQEYVVDLLRHDLLGPDNQRPDVGVPAQGQPR